MAFISDSFQNNKLKNYNINITTKYIVKDKIKVRNTNNKNNDDIINGIRCKNEYYLNDKLIHEEQKFDSRIEYTFISKNIENSNYTCPNCGTTFKLNSIDDCCPYCKSYYNIEYINKDLGSKYHYDRVLQSNKYRIITGLIDLIISIMVCYIFIKNTSRTFNEYDIFKILIYGVILTLVLYYFFYMLDAYVVLIPIKIYKDKQNQKQIDFWNKTNIDKKLFFNNLNYELRKYYYNKDKVIDFDVIDYISFKELENNNICVAALIRIVYFEDNKIKSKNIKDTYILKKVSNNTLDLDEGVNIIRCNNCGATIDAKYGVCHYCNSKIKPLNLWVLQKK